jgi:hypothetical protein
MTSRSGTRAAAAEQDTPRRSIRPSLVAAAVLAAIGLAWLLLGLMALPQGSGWGFDFGAYRDGAVRLVETGTLYQPETVTQPFRPGPIKLFLYPPPSGAAMLPFTALGEHDGALTWHVLHIVMLVLACAALPVSLTVRLAVFGVAALSHAVTFDISVGNVSSTLLLPLALAWRWLDRPGGAIAQAVAICVRPTLGIIVVWQLLRRQWRAVAWTAGAGIVIVALTLPIVGIDDYVDYVAVLRNLSDAIGVERNLDLGSTALRLGLDTSLGSVALIVGYAIAIGAVLLSLRRDREVGFVVAAMASLLLAPVLWDHYLALTVLPAALLASRGHAWALVLPLLTWLPPGLQPFVAVLAMLLPLALRDPDRAASSEPSPSLASV